ncbi:MAG: DUF1360 domain-containing protein [Candidatus Pacebacteria bacterium]|jgi:hypothetical protein|nr:DUF1360 domain-containing protein [Candidatus Paceibacterota bacterium]
MNVSEKKWNIILSFFFVFLTALFTQTIYRQNRLAFFGISAFDLVILVLATFRLIRLVVFDDIFLWLRDLTKDPGETDIFDGFRSTMRHLLHCPWCVGVWASLFVVFFYCLTPLSHFFLLVLAVAGTASFVQLLANLIGWNAELGKIGALRANESKKTNAHP